MSEIFEDYNVKLVRKNEMGRIVNAFYKHFEGNIGGVVFGEYCVYTERTGFENWIDITIQFHPKLGYYLLIRASNGNSIGSGDYSVYNDLKLHTWCSDDPKVDNDDSREFKKLLRGIITPTKESIKPIDRLEKLRWFYAVLENTTKHEDQVSIKLGSVNSHFDNERKIELHHPFIDLQIVSPKFTLLFNVKVFIVGGAISTHVNVIPSTELDKQNELDDGIKWGNSVIPDILNNIYNKAFFKK